MRAVLSFRITAELVKGREELNQAYGGGGVFKRLASHLAH